MTATLSTPVDGDVVACTWPDGEMALGYTHEDRWFRWDRRTMLWGPAEAPAAWREVAP